jgi:hypothetical protein
MYVVLNQNSGLIELATAAIIACLLFVTCSSEPKPGLRDEDLLVEAMVQLEIGFKMAREDKFAYGPVRDSILYDLGIDTTWLADRMEELNQDPDRWLEIWERVTARLSTLKDSLTP